MQRGRRVAVIGRFQPFHWGHFEYLTEAASLGEILVVGVANPTTDQRRFTSSDLERSTDEANPFSFDQRRRMIEAGLERTAKPIKMEIRACDLRTPERLRESLGSCDLVAVTIYDGWGHEKSIIASEAKYDVIIMWERTEKLVTGSEIRRRLQMKEPWEHLVPPGTAKVIEDELAK